MLSPNAVLGGATSPLSLLTAALETATGLAGPLLSGAGPSAAPLAAAALEGPAAAKAGPAKKATAPKPAAPKSTTKAGGAKKPTRTKKAASPRKTSTARKDTKGGYATNLPPDYAFLRDPKLSIEEKLSRFIGMMMAKSEQDLLRQMEKMAPGASPTGAGGAGGPAGGGTGGSGKTGSTGRTGRAGGAGAADGADASGGTTWRGGAARSGAATFNLWDMAKSAVPALGMASSVVGDDQLKGLIGQLSGPVLAAACSAVGLPMLAPVAQQLGPQLFGALTKDVSVDLGFLSGGGQAGGLLGVGSAGASGPWGAAKAGASKGTGGAKGTGTGSGGATASTGQKGGAGTAAAAGAGDGATSEKAQLLELQRLQDRDKELFSLFSNMMKAMHDARMTSIQNIR